MQDFEFQHPDDVALVLAERLGKARLAQGLRQSDLATRAGVALNAVKTLEGSGRSTMLTFLRVVSALGLSGELNGLFLPKAALSIADMEKAQAPVRQRAPRSKAVKRV